MSDAFPVTVAVSIATFLVSIVVAITVGIVHGHQTELKEMKTCVDAGASFIVEQNAYVCRQEK